jgi:hypothetical protein
MSTILKAHLVDQAVVVAPEGMLEPHSAAAQAGQGHRGKEMLVVAEAQTMCRTVLGVGVAAQVGLAQTSPREQAAAVVRARHRLLLDHLSLGLGVVRGQASPQTDRLDRGVEEQLMPQGRLTQVVEVEVNRPQEQAAQAAPVL